MEMQPITVKDLTEWLGRHGIQPGSSITPSVMGSALELGNAREREVNARHENGLRRTREAEAREVARAMCQPPTVAVQEEYPQGSGAIEWRENQEPSDANARELCVA